MAHIDNLKTPRKRHSGKHVRCYPCKQHILIYPSHVEFNIFKNSAMFSIVSKSNIIELYAYSINKSYPHICKHT